MNEPSVFNGPDNSMPIDSRQRIDAPSWATRNTTHRELHNVLGLLNTEATYEGMLRLRPDTRPYVLTRSTFAGGQKYAATWTGDNYSTWNHLRLSTPMLLNLGLSGFAYSGDDIGGYAMSPSPELLTRWIEVGAFNPIFRDHTEAGTADQEVWVHGPEHLAIRRRYIEERYKLLPYLYTLAEEASRTGIPMMRPLLMEFPATQHRHLPLDLEYPGKFMLGSSIMVAPQEFGETPDSYKVFLPGPEKWFDYWTGLQIGTDVTGEVTISPKLDVLPVFVRPGSIIPTQPLTQSTSEVPQGPLRVKVYPGHPCSGSLYDEDDGETFAYRRGHFLRLQFTCALTTSGVTISVEKPQGDGVPWWRDIEFTIYGWTSSSADVRNASSDESVTFSIDYAQHSLRFAIPYTSREISLIAKEETKP